jgi:hypothetical protein
VITKEKADFCLHLSGWRLYACFFFSIRRLLYGKTSNPALPVTYS